MSNDNNEGSKGNNLVNLVVGLVLGYVAYLLSREFEEFWNALILVSGVLIINKGSSKNSVIMYLFGIGVLGLGIAYIVF